MDDDDLMILKAVSAREISWREGMYDLGLSNAQELLAALTEAGLPSPFEAPPVLSKAELSDIRAFIAPLEDGETA